MATIEKPARNGQVGLLLGLIDEAFDKRAWHGTNLRGALRGIDARQASWRPGPGRHNIWELALHAAYWKYAVRRRLTGEQHAEASAHERLVVCDEVADAHRRPPSSGRRALRT